MSIFEWPFKTGFTVFPNPCYKVNDMCYKGTVLYQEKNMQVLVGGFLLLSSQITPFNTAVFHVIFYVVGEGV